MEKFGMEKFVGKKEQTEKRRRNVAWNDPRRKGKEKANSLGTLNSKREKRGFAAGDGSS